MSFTDRRSPFDLAGTAKPDGRDVSGTSSFAYLGWDGRGNMGDDAIRLALERALPSASFVSLPHSVGELGAFLAGPSRVAARQAHLLMGGGTVIGRRNWRYLLTPNLWLTGGRPALMIGAGVEDPVFQGRHSFSSRGELGRWKSVLEQFDRVTVRGPRSAALLAELGVDAPVVGDPALLLHAPAGVEVQDDVIGVCLGFGSDLWSHGQDGVVEEVAGLVRRLVRQSGMRARFYVLNVEDIRWSVQCAGSAGLGIGDYEIVLADDPDRYLSSVASCAVLVGQRLHAVILAFAAGVPSVMLEYQPKCRDFMESVDHPEWSFRTDRLVGGDLFEVIGGMREEREMLVGQIRQTIDRFRALLAEEVCRIGIVSGTTGA